MQTDAHVKSHFVLTPPHKNLPEGINMATVESTLRKE